MVPRGYSWICPFRRFVPLGLFATLALFMWFAEPCPAAPPWLAVTQAEDFLRQEGSLGVAEVEAAVGGKVLGYEFGRRPGHWAEYRLTVEQVEQTTGPGLIWFYTARHYADPARWTVYWDGEALPQVVNFPTTGSWFVSRWSSVPLDRITPGEHLLKIVAAGENANVNFDLIGLTAAGVTLSEIAAGMLPAPTIERIDADIDSLARAIKHLRAEYPSRFGTDGALHAELGELQAARAELTDREMRDEPALRRLDRRRESLARRALVEQNPLMAFDRLLFTRRRPLGGQHYAYTEALSWTRDRPRVFKPGASLVTLSPPRADGKLEILIESPHGIIRDPDVHFDGRRVLFSDRKSLDGDDYHLYEIDLATREIRQLTDAAGFADYEGCYLPDGNIIFSSTRCVQTVDCYPTPVSNLYLANGDGGNVRRVTVNPVHDNFPSVLDDGRVVFTRWEYNDRWVLYLQGLAVMNPDGTAGTAYYGNNSYWPISMLHARAVPGTGRIVCTLSGHHDVDQCGEIGLFDVSLGTQEAAGCVRLWPRRDIEPIRDEFYWRNLSAQYQYPYPLSENFFLVSCKPRGAAHFGIYLIDTFGNQTLVWADPDISCSSPMPLVARTRPPVLPSRVRYDETEATIYLADVYRGRAMRDVARGEVKSLRIVEVVNRPTGTPHWAGMDGTPPMGLCSSWDAKRVVGVVPVDEDGSAVFRVPAGAAIYFQPLDADGKALQWMRSWVTLQPGETVGCVGCHDSVGQTPPAEFAELMIRQPVRPKPWVSPPGESFSFPRDVQPVLDRKCVSCHDQDDPAGLDLRADKTDGFSLAYEHLRLHVRVPGTRAEPPAERPRKFGAIASPLVELLEAGHHDVKLTSDEMDRLITWIDLNAPYYGSYALTRYHANFGRCVVSDAEPLWRALDEACGGCHKLRGAPPNVPEAVFDHPLDAKRERYGFTWAGSGSYNTRNAVLVNLTHPGESRLLRAPLSKDAGGLGLCGSSVFATTDDAGYQAALRVIAAWSADLAAHPREDMPGATPCDEYQVWQAKRDESDAIEAESRRALSR